MNVIKPETLVLVSMHCYSFHFLIFMPETSFRASFYAFTRVFSFHCFFALFIFTQLFLDIKDILRMKGQLKKLPWRFFEVTLSKKFRFLATIPLFPQKPFELAVFWKLFKVMRSVFIEKQLFLTPVPLSSQRQIKLLTSNLFCRSKSKT